MDNLNNPRLIKRLDDLLAEKKMQISEVCKAAEITRRAFYDIYEGKTQKPKNAVIGKIAEAFGVPPRELLDLVDKKPKKQKEKSEKEELALFIRNVIPGLNENQLHLLSSFIETKFGIKKDPKIVSSKRNA